MTVYNPRKHKSFELNTPTPSGKEICAGLLQSLGWVEQAACRPYTPSAADSALVSVMPEVAAGGYCPGEDSASHAVCARALKLAAQYQNTNDVQQASACNSSETMCNVSG